MASPSEPERVVITGLGAVTPIGIGRDEFWQGLMAGRVGVGPVSAFDTRGLSVGLAYEVRDFRPERHLPPGLPPMGRAAQLALAACREALDDAGLDLAELEPEAVGLCLGTIGGELRVLEDVCRRRQQGREVEAWSLEQLGYDAVPREVARGLGIAGPQAVTATACAAGNYALGLAAHLLRAGEAVVVLAGGADPLSHMIMSGFCRLKAVDPERCRPFDLNRQGMMVGEGAGVLVLETLARARRRGARVYAELAGCGLSCDAFHVTAMDPKGEGLALAMSRALDQAGVAPAEVEYVCAHGTGTPTNDRVETLALRRVFGERAAQVPVSSLKSMLGHAMGASSAMEAVACALAIRRGGIPPTMNFETPDPECALDVVPNVAREAKPRVVISNAAAFGGNNSCAVFRALD